MPSGSPQVGYRCPNSASVEGGWMEGWMEGREGGREGGRGGREGGEGGSPRVPHTLAKIAICYCILLIPGPSSRFYVTSYIHTTCF